MSKVTCHQKGNLFIKCKSCGYSWNTSVVMHQEVDDTCPNCQTHTQHHVVLTVDAKKGDSIKLPPTSINIPEFMDDPQGFVTLTDAEYAAITERNARLIKSHYKMGFNTGLSLGLSIGLLILVIVLFFLFAPIHVLMA